MKPLTAARRASISSWPLPEAVAGAALAAGVLMVVLKGPEVQRGILGLVYLALLLVMAVYDARTLRVPNRIVYPSLCLGVAGSLTLGLSQAAEPLLGGVAAFLVLLVIFLVGRGAMGFADVKVGCLCGIAVGLNGVAPMLLITFFAGALLGGVLLGLRISKPKNAVPFTPFLVGATAFSMSFFNLYLWS
jgi:prepilin signal peptidase PulO-like enzyme (type II secretory pathway)